MRYPLFLALPLALCACSASGDGYPSLLPRPIESRVAIARGVPAGSDSWLAAQTALAELNSTRGETVEIVTSLEETAAARLQAGTPAYPALDAAIASLSRAAAEQADKVQALEDALAG